MKFEKLTKADKEKAKALYYDKKKPWDVRMRELMKLFGRSERITRTWLVKLGLKEKVVEESKEFLDAKKRKFNKEKKVFFFTWAQNKTPIHKNFLANMEAYAEFLDADIHVIAGRYKNPTSVFTDKKYDTWASEVVPYLDANRHDIHKYLSILSDIKIQPTAENPLNGIKGVSGTNSCIVGSPRVHMEVIPALQGYKPKVMWTTGAVTKKNYTDSKSGKQGEFHHMLGFVIVEIRDKEKFFCRQVTATENGDFIDLFHEVKSGNITEVKSISAAVLGDMHLGQENKAVLRETKKLLDKLKPDYTIIHDIFDGESVNPHEVKNPFKQYKKEKEGKNILKKEVDTMIEWLSTWQKYNLAIVRSNHDDFLDRWLIDTDWKKNIKNSMEYMEYAKVLLNDEAPDGIIPYIINKNFKNIKTLGINDSFRVNGWELAVHGHVGKSGSRGSIDQYRSLSTKLVTGHSHTPGRKDGALVVGTHTELRVGYNVGASSWLHADVIIHRDGKAQHILYIGDNNVVEYTTFNDPKFATLLKNFKPKKKDITMVSETVEEEEYIDPDSTQDVEYECPECGAATFEEEELCESCELLERREKNQERRNRY